jgi:hypothetical protein
MTDHPMTCAEFEALASDYLEAHALAPAERAAAESHMAGCVECASLVADLRTIVRDAGELPALAPGRDLWSGIDERIEAPVVAIGTSVETQGSPELRREAAGEWREAAGERREAYGESYGVRREVYGVSYGVRRLAIAASVLVAVTAGVTYTLARRPAGIAVAPDAAAPSMAPDAPPSLVRAAGNRPTAAETFDREIASIRAIVDERRGELDTATTRIVEKNLKLIDAAIAESKAALAKDPASAFLLEQLTHAYDTKLRLLRGLATLPART